MTADDSRLQSPDSQGTGLAPSRDEKLLRILSGEDRGVGTTLARAGLWLLSPLYGLVIGAYRGMYDTELLKEVRLPCPVLSIGNLTVGGTGKTGLALTLAQLLRDHGLQPALLNYGYHAGIGRGPAVVSDGERVLLTPKESGDEAALLAQSLPGVPVLIGKRRVESGALALERFRPDVLLLDDAFQYWRLHRDLNLVLISATEPWGYSALLPRGLLREMPSALRRASAVILTHTVQVSADALDRLRTDVHRLAPRIPVFTANYAPQGLREWTEGEATELSALCGMKVGAMSALGSPADFEASLKAWGASVVHPYRFPDHYAYSPDDLLRVRADAARRGLEGIVTTAKDAVKLRTPDISYMADGAPPLYVLEVAMRVEPWDEFSDWVLSGIRQAQTSLSTAPD
ncbi:MAG: tetraacyldisaccharide 4'-kinase [Armatimonadetes bacterium]|nr:tetraacyldisaccharide 4'-kinase [Armatimonadota bacterium]